MKRVTAYKAADGSLHATPGLCEHHDLKTALAHFLEDNNNEVEQEGWLELVERLMLRFSVTFVKQKKKPAKSLKVSRRREAAQFENEEDEDY